MSEDIFKYFPWLSVEQKKKLHQLNDLYRHWNNVINVVSRKDIDNLMVHHVLHSLSISMLSPFNPGNRILDVGTGGGFPGIPLAILYPESEFTLLDSIAKKIKVVRAITEELNLKNVIPVCKRVEDEKGKYNFIISRAVTAFPEFVKLTAKNVKKIPDNKISSGIYCLKGGDLSEEISIFKDKVKVLNISEFFDEPYFKTKKIVFLPH